MEERALGSQYRLSTLLGRGAMGQVFEGSDANGHRYAFKVLRDELVGDPDLVARFLQERSILCALRHPNLVGVHDLVVEGETVAITMDLVSGGDLRQWLNANGPLLPTEVARIGAGVASALAAVHAAGVVHRDVKPENILMDDSTPQRTPRLTDFGISRLANSTDLGRRSLLAGTPEYLAPELSRGEEPTPSADLYSLGIVLYELCCGVTPFAGKPMLTVIRLHDEAEPGRPEGIPNQLWDLISWLLAKKPSARPQTAQQVATMLDALVMELIGVPVAPRLTVPPDPNQLAQDVTMTALPVAAAPPAFPPNPAVRGEPVRKRRRGRAFLVGAATVLVLAAVAFIALRPVGNNTSSASGSTTSPSTTAAGDSSTSSTTTLTTTVAAMSTVPNLVGKTVAQAQDALPSSVHVTTVNVVEQTAADGTVVDQDPKAGQPLNGTVQLTVARSAVQIYLASLHTVNGQWNSELNLAHIGGTTLQNAVGIGVDSSYTESQSVEYNVAKGFRRLQATAGIDDNARDSKLVVQVQIFGDDRPLATTSVSYGKPFPIDVDLSGVLRLRIQWQITTGSRNECCPNGYLEFGNAVLLGLPGEVPSTTTTTTY